MFKTGDHVVVGVKDSFIVHKISNRDSEISVTIIGKLPIECGFEYFGYIPEYESHKVKNTVIISNQHLQKFSIHRKYLHEHAIVITQDNALRIAYKADGMQCVTCDDFVLMAGPNFEDQHFMCIRCKSNRY